MAEQLASKSVVLNASGNGTVQLGPSFSSDRWRVTNTAVNTSTATAHPTCRTFLGSSAVPSAQLDATFAGDNDSSDTVYELAAGQRVTVQWTGGDNGATATCTLYGERMTA
jgi:hypothetical protein